MTNSIYRHLDLWNLMGGPPGFINRSYLAKSQLGMESVLRAL